MRPKSYGKENDDFQQQVNDISIVNEWYSKQMHYVYDNIKIYLWIQKEKRNFLFAKLVFTWWLHYRLLELGIKAILSSFWSNIKLACSLLSHSELRIVSIDANQTKFLKLSETLSFFVSYQTFIEYIEARIFRIFENAVYIQYLT